ncbi:MAG: hypothetical protein ACREKE_07880 [bacterium]
MFKSLGHSFAWILHQFLPATEKDIQTVITTASGPIGQAIVGLLGAKAVGAQSGIEAIAGDVLKSFVAAGAAIGASGLNVQFDETTIQAIGTLYHDLAGLFGKAPK